MARSALRYVLSNTELNAVDQRDLARALEIVQGVLGRLRR